MSLLKPVKKLCEYVPYSLCCFGIFCCYEVYFLTFQGTYKYFKYKDDNDDNDNDDNMMMMMMMMMYTRCWMDQPYQITEKQAYYM